ncbi:DNA gyrase, a subunit [Heliomicrobium modesticaldum Ice1]|uniref:DNA gyrase subunit A n=1 Tax=Heliobacterium modesticaldum (strain ATCC 51547 / Ice1) TaxID=498761 RepID=B0TAN1_HELMI|nr:DNA gyrase subunit A [Heliomicrobium modesticaldum]ABZ83683.1 DNA gyrase, a subunit [Heliomicrobium modesticaldum Ice1]
MSDMVGKVVPIKLEEEMKKSFLDYSMSVIVSRALPDVRDGLKPVHRRILYTLYETGRAPDKPYSKSAGLVGDVMGRYHPHGDSAIYDATVRLAQDFSTRYMLIDGHGNFGSIDGDPAAAMRYTELRMAKITSYILADIDKNTVDFKPNYDDKREEPTVLPSRVPNLLLNGSSGIAVGMATNIPPHNLAEIIDAVIMMIENPKATVEDLMRVVKGPDFPTGALIMGREGIRQAYTTGRGSIIMRAKARIEKMNGNKMRILVHEIPYQVNKSKLLERIAELVRDKRVDGITDLRDESDRRGMQIVIELRRDVNPQIVLNQLFKYTQMQETFGVIMLALVDGVPKVLNLRDMLYYYLEHQKDVIVRRTRYDLEKAEARAHILEGLRIAIDNIDRIIEIIRTSRDEDEARPILMGEFNLSEKQAQAILDMRLKRLAGLEREKIENEYQELLSSIAYYRAVLHSEKMVLDIIKKEISEIKEKFADPRRTEITSSGADIDVEDLIAEEDAVITITHNGYIKRLPVNTYKAQRRGGRGVTGMGTKEDDFVEHLFVTTTHHTLLFFTDRGKVYRLKTHEIPEASRTAKGTAIVNLLAITGDEKVNAVIPVKEFAADQYLFTATRSGIVKKTSLQHYDTVRKEGLIALTLDEGDELIGVKLTDGKSDILLATRNGMAVRFNETNVREMGRTARGVKGIELTQGDFVVALDAVKDDDELLMITELGMGKRTPLSEYRKQNRGGKGILAMRLTNKTGLMAGIKVVRPGDELMVISAEGVIIRLNVDEINVLSRVTQGVSIMRMNANDKVVALARVAMREEDEE